MIRPSMRLEADARAHALFDMDICAIIADTILLTRRRHRDMTRRGIRDLKERALETRRRIETSTGPSDPAHAQAYVDQISIEHERDHMLFKKCMIPDVLNDPRAHPVLKRHETMLNAVRSRNPKRIATSGMTTPEFLDAYIVERSNPEAHAIDAERRRQKQTATRGPGRARKRPSPSDRACRPVNQESISSNPVR